MATKTYDVTLERGQRKSDIIPLDRATIQLAGMKTYEGTAGGEGGKDVAEKDRPAYEIVSSGPGGSQVVLGERFEGTLVMTFTGEVDETVEVPHAEEQQSGKRAKDAAESGLSAGVREVKDEDRRRGQGAPQAASRAATRRLTTAPGRA